MTKSLIVPEEKQLESLFEELNAIKTETGKILRETANEIRLRYGEAIVNSPLFKKYSKGQTVLIDEISDNFDVSVSTVYFWIRFYEQRKQFELDMPWRKIVLQLGEDSNALERTPKEKCRHCPMHCQ